MGIFLNCTFGNFTLSKSLFENDLKGEGGVGSNTRLL